VRAIVAAVLAGAVGAMAMTACGGGDDEALRPRLDQVVAAIDALEAELGGPQSYFEITADPQSVRLFVAVDDATQVQRYVFIGGELAPAGDPEGASGGTFTADALDFDAATVFDQIEADLDDPDVVLLSIAGDGTGAVEYQATVQSDEGGTLEIVLGPDGAVRSAAPGT